MNLNQLFIEFSIHLVSSSNCWWFGFWWWRNRWRLESNSDSKVEIGFQLNGVVDVLLKLTNYWLKSTYFGLKCQKEQKYFYLIKNWPIFDLVSPFWLKLTTFAQKWCLKKPFKSICHNDSDLEDKCGLYFLIKSWFNPDLAWNFSPSWYNCQRLNCSHVYYCLFYVW